MSALGGAWNAGDSDVKFPGGVPGGVARWAGVASQALQMAGALQSWLYSLLMRMNRESGGNPFAVNNWDSNAAAGDPSRGLMQTIGSTFNAYAGALRGKGIYDPLANIYAAVRYTISRYGSGPAGWNRAGGYDSGGWLMPGWTPAFNGTGSPERVLGPGEGAGSGNAAVIFNHYGPLIGDDVDSWIVQKLDRLKRQGRVA